MTRMPRTIVLAVFVWIICVLMIAGDIWAAAVYDNTCTGSVASGTTMNCTLTITSTANNAGMVGISFAANSATSISVSGASGTWAAVSGTDSGTAQTSRTIIYAASALTSGSQQITVSWTGSMGAEMGVVTASGVNQSTPAVNGNTNNGTGATATVAVTSNDGLAMDAIASSKTLSSPTQTQRWLGSTGVNAGGSTSTSAGSVTFQWSVGSGGGRNWTESGAAFKAVAAVGSRLLLLGVGQ